MELNKLLELYNPNNVKNLTEDDIQYLPKLMAEELKALAERYPNKVYGLRGAYLVLRDLNTKGDTKPVSTWENAYNLIVRHKHKNFVVVNFTARFNTKQKETIVAGISKDLTAEDLKKAEGVKPVGQPGIVNDLSIVPPQPDDLTNITNDGNGDNFADLDEEAKKAAEGGNQQPAATQTGDPGTETVNNPALTPAQKRAAKKKAEGGTNTQA